jgi:DNA-binding SARP family transcriptional activator/tetratricopeptide (TPR) repeat protein
VRLFGQVALTVDGQVFALATPRKSLQVLAYLLLHRDAPVSRDYLAFLLWPDEEEGIARTRLRATLSDLLRVLPQPSGDFVGTSTDALWWNRDVDLWLDVDAFVDASRDVTRLEEAVALYRGELLPELYDEWLDSLRERFRNVYQAVLAQLVSQMRMRGDLTRAISAARMILEADPWREDIVRRIVALRYELGDAAGAIHEYRDFAGRLREEMGVDPMPETVAVAERVLKGDVVAQDEGEPSSAVDSRVRERSRSLPFRGREREMERLSEAWGRAKMQRGGVVFVGGEPGIGKSRLVREFAASVEESGGRALYGATGFPEAFPYQSLVEALRGQLPLVTALDLGPTWFAALATVVPEVAGRIAALPQLPTIGADDQRLRLFEAFGRAFLGLARPRPLLVVLEDLHWASQATFDALAFLARRASGARILFLLTFRDDEVLARHPLRQLQRETKIEGSAVSLSVLPLDCGVVERIVDETGAPFNGTLPEFAAALHRRSSGNPLFLAQLLESPSPQESLPATVASLVGARVAALSTETQTVAEVAALAGQRFSAEVVRDVTGYNDAAVDRALDELLDRRIVQETAGRGILPYAFGHQLVQQAIAQLVEPGRLRERSRRMARALKQLYPEREREFASQIAAHLETAEHSDEAAKEYLIAGRYALDLGAPDDARRHIDRALGLATERTTRVALLRERQRIDERASNVAEERADLDALAAIAEEIDDEDLRCNVLLRRAHIAFNDFTGRSEAFAPLADLRERARRSGSLRWQADADLLESMFYPLGVAAGQTLVFAERALGTYRELGDEIGAARALAEMSRTLFVSGKIEEGRRAAQEALATAEAMGDYALAERALSHATSNAQDFLDRDAVVQWNARWLELTAKAGDRRCEADALGQSTWPLLWSPNFLDALPILDRAAQICRDCGLAPALTVNEMNAAEFEIKLGRFDTAIATFERAIETYASVAPFFVSHARSNLVLPLTYGGSAQRAVALGREVVGAVDETESLFAREDALHNLAEAEYATGNLPAAIERLEEAVKIRRTTSAAIAAAHHGALLAAYCAQAGNYAAALVHAELIPKNEPERSVGLMWPQRSAWCAAFTYHACGDSAAAKEWLHRATGLYEAHLPHLDDDQRTVFALLPWHRAIEAARAGSWPSTVW